MNTDDSPSNSSEDTKATDKSIPNETVRRRVRIMAEDGQMEMDKWLSVLQTL